jgi:hypothetical protein
MTDRPPASGEPLTEYEERDAQIWGEVPPRDGVDAYARESDPFYRPPASGEPPIDPRACPNKEAHKDEACDVCGLVMDYPTAFAFIAGSDVTDHHERCSYRAGMLCDCDILNREYERRKVALNAT